MQEIKSIKDAEVAGKRVPLHHGFVIGTAAVPRSDGKLTALEVVVFPEAMRGTGEGHYGWDLAPESTMTNAMVYAAEAVTDG